jgi:dUTP pyrophosphatase
MKQCARTLKVKYLTTKAHALTRGTLFSAGLDLCSAYKYTIPPLSRLLIRTDLSFTLPSGTYGRIAPRSGLAYKHGIDVFAGVIDQDYRGPVGVILFNSDSTTSFQIEPGDRIAQLIVEKIEDNVIISIEKSLENTNRGGQGFGSTGVKIETEEESVDESEDESVDDEELEKKETSPIFIDMDGEVVGLDN